MQVPFPLIRIDDLGAGEVAVFAFEFGCREVKFYVFAEIGFDFTIAFHRNNCIFDLFWTFEGEIDIEVVVSLDRFAFVVASFDWFGQFEDDACLGVI